MSFSFFIFLKGSHNLQFTEFDNKRKRADEEEESTPSTSTQKQAKLTDYTKVPPSQTSVNILILNYIVDDVNIAKPLSPVESDSFIKLVKGLCPSASVMTRKTLGNIIDAEHDKMVHSLQKTFEEANYI